MATLKWIEFAKPLMLTGKSLNETIIDYCQIYSPGSVAAAGVVVDEILKMVEHIPLPPTSAELPDDIPVALRIVDELLRQRYEN